MKVGIKIMKKRLFKLAVALFTGLIFTASTVPYAAYAVESANSLESNEEVFSSDEEKAINEAFTNLELNGVRRPQTRAGGTAAVKASIRYILKNQAKLFKFIDQYAGKSAGNLFRKHFGKVTPVLNDLLKWQSVAYGNIEGLVASALIRAGVNSGVARTIAWALRQAAEWLI